MEAREAEKQVRGWGQAGRQDRTLAWARFHSIKYILTRKLPLRTSSTVSRNQAGRHGFGDGEGRGGDLSSASLLPSYIHHLNRFSQKIQVSYLSQMGAWQGHGRWKRLGRQAWQINSIKHGSRGWSRLGRRQAGAHIGCAFCSTWDMLTADRQGLGWTLVNFTISHL